MMILRVLAVLVLALIALGAAAFAGLFDPKAPPRAAAIAAPPRLSLAIAPRDEALTFARVALEGRMRTIAVDAYEDGVLSGAPIDALLAPGEDAAGFVGRLGYDGALAQIETVRSRIAASAEGALVPIDLGAAHVAAGVNFRAHAEEAAVEGGPFLFPKFAAPTQARAPLPAGEGLLDYEAELCLVVTAPIAAGAPAQGGLLACNDVTDRARLLRGIDPGSPQSGAGFADGKSGDGFLPVGDLYVAPRDLGAFAKGLTLELSVNEALRQSAPAALQIWDFDRILAEARARKDARWTYRGGPAALPLDTDGAVLPRALVLGGTPGGTIFRGIYPSAYARGAAAFIGDGLRGDPAARVIEAHIAEAEKRGDYLRRGDLVAIKIDRLGALANKVE